MPWLGCYLRESPPTNLSFASVLSCHQNLCMKSLCFSVKSIVILSFSTATLEAWVQPWAYLHFFQLRTKGFWWKQHEIFVVCHYFSHVLQCWEWSIASIIWGNEIDSNQLFDKMKQQLNDCPFDKYIGVCFKLKGRQHFLQRHAQLHKFKMRKSKERGKREIQILHLGCIK